MTGTCERWYPYWLALPGPVITLLVARYIEFDEAHKLAILQSIISVAAILIGFLGTALAIVTSFMHREIMLRLAALGQIKVMVHFFTQPMYGLFITLIMSVGLLVWDDGWQAYVFVGILGYAAVFSLLCIQRLHLPLKNIVEQAGEEA